MRGRKQFPPKIQFVFLCASDFLWVGSDFLKISTTLDSACFWNKGKTRDISPARGQAQPHQEQGACLSHEVCQGAFPTVGYEG